MKKLAIAGLGALWMLLAGGGIASAAESGVITTTNKSTDSVWITYYSVTKEQLGTHCLKAGDHVNKDFNWDHVLASYGGVYLRFEYKADTDCGGKTYYDSHYGGLYKMPGVGDTLTVNIPPL